MDTFAPATVSTAELLRRDLCRHLDEAESVALENQSWERHHIDIARELVPYLVLVLRGLLMDHQARPGGDCRTCASAWPCPVVALMHALLEDPDNQFAALTRRVLTAE